MQMQVRLPKNYECWAREAFREGDDTIPADVMQHAYWVLDSRTDHVAGGATPEGAVAAYVALRGNTLACDTLVDVVEGPGLEELTAEYEGFLEETKLPGTDAEDLLLTCQAAIPYLSSFIMRWEAAETREQAEEAERLAAEKAAKLAEARAKSIAQTAVTIESARLNALKADEEAFDPLSQWASTRVWCADLVAAAPHVADMFPDEEDQGRIIRGYVYHDGSWLVEERDGTSYWAPLGQWDTTGTLDEVEHELWEHHAQHNIN
jgi:hypothetical protein